MRESDDIVDSVLCEEERTKGDENADANLDFASSPMDSKVANRTTDRSDIIFDISEKEIQGALANQDRILISKTP